MVQLRTRVASAAAIALGMVACSSGPTQPLISCLQTGEFANYGCARLSGRVSGATGQPLIGAFVSLHAPEDAALGGYNAVSGKTGADGKFTLELTRFGQRPAPLVPDTLTASLAATWAVGADIVARQTVPVLLEFMPVGEVAKVTETQVQLAVP